MNSTNFAEKRSNINMINSRCLVDTKTLFSNMLKDISPNFSGGDWYG